MKKDYSSVDGFVPRRPRSQVGELQNPRATKRPADANYRPLHTGLNTGHAVGTPRQDYSLGEAAKHYDDTARLKKSDVSDALQQIDDEPTKGKLGRRAARKNRFSGAPKPRRRRKIILWIVITLVVILLGVGAYLAYTLFKAGDNVLQGNIFEIIQNEPLKEDQNGRSNFLVFGTSEDDPGHEKGNGDLTDSMLVVSVDQNKKNAIMFSVPRDLYVQYGEACLSGYSGKINAYYKCVNAGETDADEQERIAALQKKVGEVFGLDIQYGAHVNYTVVRDVINAIGGEITVTIEGNGPTPAGIPAGSVMDANFDWKCGATYAQRMANCPPRGHYIDYGPGPQTIDAEHALYLAQARGASDNWGLAQSNFDREKNQQKIAVAIKDKALSAGTLTNLGAVTGLINALGNNLRTNVQTKEVRTIMALANDIPAEAIRSVSLIDAEPALLTTGSPVPGAGSLVFPIAGLTDYSQLQAYIAQKISSDPVVAEAANVSVLNGSGTPGVARTEADKLIAAKYTVDEVADAPAGEWTAPFTVYQLNDDNPGTAAALAKLFGVKLITEKPPFSVVGETDFIVVVGPAASTSGQTTSR